MSMRVKSFASFATIAAVPLAFASAQTAPPPQAVPQATPPAAQQPAPTEAVPAPVVYPTLAWSPRDAVDLLAFIQQVGSEGLNPLDYDPAGLTAALQTGSIEAISVAANERFKLLSTDLALGHVRRDERQGWHISDKDLDEERQFLLLRSALQQHRVGDALRGLLPTHPQYAALKNALMVTPKSETAKINRIRLNMDRWRWLPRDLGDRYIIVNVPAYHVALVEGGETQWRQKAIAGAIKTPTPMISATATGVILNPWWEVPKSIEPEVRGKRGYVAVKRKDGTIQRWRQPPGPANALGKVKFVMPNPQAIYLHDTNARSRFNDQIRSLSHGCIRTKDIIDLSAMLLAEDGGEWTREKVDETLKSGKTVQASFVKPLPVYIVYFSSAAALDGSIIDYADIYKRDAKVLEALVDGKRANTKVASR